MGEESDVGAEEELARSNKTQVGTKRELSPAQVWGCLDQPHKELVPYLRTIPDSVYAPDSYTGDWIATDSLGHYRSHREDLERWKASRND